MVLPRPRARWWAVLLAPLAWVGALEREGLPTAWSAPEDPAEVVEATLEWEPSTLGPPSTLMLPLAPPTPTEVGLPPELVEGRCTRIPWGAGPALVVAADVSADKARIWVDTDLDGELTDEVRDAWTKTHARWTRSETVRVVYAGEGAPEEVPIRLEREIAWEPDKVRIVTGAHRQGLVVLAGRLRRVALADRNADMRFDDPATDRLYLDVDGDGLLAVGEESHERVEPGRPTRVGDEGWAAEVTSPSGRKVRFVRSAEVPPKRPRPWQPPPTPAAGARAVAPDEAPDAVLARIDAEASQPTAARLPAIALLGRYESTTALRRLLRLFEHDNDPHARVAAVRALGNPAWLEEAGPTLIQLSEGPRPLFMAAALDALHLMGHPRREERCLALLGHAEPLVVEAALRNLGYQGTPTAAEALRTAHEKAKDPNLRLLTYLALRHAPLGPPPVLARRAARDEREEHLALRARGLRDVAALELDDAEALALEVAALRPVNGVLAATAIDILGEIGSRRGVESLLDLAAVGPRGLDVALLRALGPVRNAGALKAILAGLGHEEPRMRGLCAQMLAGVREPGVVEALLARAGREKDEPTLVAFLEALRDQRDPRASDLLLAHAKGKLVDPRRVAILALARMGLQDEQVRAFFTGLLASKDWEDRVVALDAVATTRDAALAAKVAASLEHERIAVRLAAVEALGTMRLAAGIPPLIARLEPEQELRVRDEIAIALHGLTGMLLYDDLRAWRGWWAANGAGFVVPERVPPLPAADAGGTRAGFYGIPVRSSRVVFVIDQSASMEADDATPLTTKDATSTRLEVAVQQTLRAIEGMQDRDQVNVVLFHSSVSAWRKDLQPLSSATRGALKTYLLDQKPIGGTNLYDGLQLAMDADGVDTVFLLSDGAPNAGRYVATDDILRSVRRINQTRRIAIHCISLGRDSDLMQQLASENSGQYVRR